MINKLKYATIADIGVFDLIFYDEKKVKELSLFCTINGISYLPSKNRKTIYKLEGGCFKEKALTPELCIKPYELIFSKETLEKFMFFNYNEVHFIVEDDLIKGVVHIIDYNSEFIQVELYRALFKFEVNLRELLVKENYTNEDFISWVKDKSEISKDKNSRKHWEKRYEEINPSDTIKLDKVLAKRKEFKPFQTFYLLELLRFASDKKVIDKSKVDIDKISSLRNQVAHSNNLTTYSKEDGQLIYNYKFLAKYVDQINAFFKAQEYLLFTKDNC